jgi:hypothetical protein
MSLLAASVLVTRASLACMSALACVIPIFPPISEIQRSRRSGSMFGFATTSLSATIIAFCA